MTYLIYCRVFELQVIENDELPNCICKTCSMKIVRAFEFRQLAKRSNEILRRFVQDKVSIDDVGVDSMLDSFSHRLSNLIIFLSAQKIEFLVAK